MARLIDSSLWIAFTRAKTPLSQKLVIQPWILDGDAYLCEAIAFEVLRHATPTERKMIEAQFATLPLLPTPSQLWRDATRIGQRCRDKGLNAGSLDLLIAATALHHQADLITLDADYQAIARIVPLRVTLLT